MIETRVERAVAADRRAIEALLGEAELPLDGLDRALDTAVLAQAGDRVVGCAALEPYGLEAILRSVAVAAGHRGEGLGARLVAEAERLAAERGIERLFLLTETAAAWFLRLGYEPADRADVSPEVAASPEFAYACPVSATLLHKRILAAGEPARATAGTPTS